MKKRIISIMFAGAFLLSVGSFASVIASDNFTVDGTGKILLYQMTTQSGTGFSNNWDWVAVVGGTRSIVQDRDADYAFVTEFYPTAQNMKRDFSSAVDATSGVLYVGLRGSAYSSSAAQKVNTRLYLRDQSGNNAITLCINDDGAVANGGTLAFVSAGGKQTTTVVQSIADYDLVELIAKIDFDNNTFTMWMNPAGEESGGIEMTATDLDFSGLTSLSGMGLANTGITAGKNLWDSIAVGTTWEDVVDEVFPVADAGPDQVVQVGYLEGSASAVLDGSASFDSDGTIESYAWSNGGSQIATGISPEVLLDVGVHVVTLTVADEDGRTSRDTVEISVERDSPIEYSSCPLPMQLYPRDRLTDTAPVVISGTVTGEDPDAVLLNVYRDDALFGSATQTLAYADGAASFRFESMIAAETNHYDFEILLQKDAVNVVSRRVEDVVAGDVYIISGQSNADARMYDGSAKENEHPFLRTFGMNSDDAAVTTNNNSWLTAVGDGSRGVGGGVGQWGLRMGRRLIDAHGIPVAIINGAHGGMAIGFFQRNDDTSEDLETNYGRLLYRVHQAGVTDGVCSILWYQGESDLGNGLVHETGFLELYNDWKEDYSGLERIYVHQLRVGCGVIKEDVDLRDRQRLLADRYPDISVMSTTGLNGHEGCHYAYENGYKLIGDHVAELISVDLYDSINVANVTAPNVDYVYFSTPEFDEITVVMRKPNDPLGMDAGVIDDFIIEGADAAVTGGVISADNKLVLRLSGDASNAAGLTYTGHDFDGSWITNGAGIGLLTFFNVSLYHSSSVPPAPSGLSANAINSEQIVLHWEAMEDVDSYVIFRNGSNLTVTTESEYTDLGLSPETQFDYDVFAVNVFGTSVVSHASAATFSAPPVPPAVPDNLTVQPLSASRVMLSWEPAENASLYRIRRNGVEIASTYKTSWVDSGLSGGVVYEYEVRAENFAGYSSYSAAVSVAMPELDVYVNVPESSGYQLVYELEIPESGVFRDTVPVPYATDFSQQISNRIDRIAYYLELQSVESSSWVFVAVDAFTQDIDTIGLPHNVDNPVSRRQLVSNMTVCASAGAGVSVGENWPVGNLEMWPGNYSPLNSAGIPGADDDQFDFGDAGSLGTASGYGSFQIHNVEERETLLAYNGWANGTVSDIGIGSRPFYDPDWTFAKNAMGYHTRRLLIFVHLDDDIDKDGLPDSWELLYFGGITNSVPEVDSDGDGQSNWQEYLSGLDPTNAASFFAIQGIECDGDCTIQWNTVSGRTYSVYWSSNLLSGFQCLESNVSWAGGEGYLDHVHSAGKQGYYRVNAELEQ